MAGYYDQGVLIHNLCDSDPKDVLVNHGPTKLLIDNYHWHSPNVGIVASYTPKDRDVEDHFNIFRGVDQIEAFAQATSGSCSVFLECQKLASTPVELSEKFVPRFLSIGQVNFIGYLEKGDTFISIGNIKFYKFRQIVCDGRIYKCPTGINLDKYFEDFTEERLLAYDIGAGFTLIAEFNDITGRSIKKELI
jgi:hypothetical protein